MKNSINKIKKIAYVGPTPAFYFLPFIRQLASNKDIDFKVYWGCDEAANNFIEREFGVVLEVRDQMLSGYKYHIVRNLIGKSTYQNGFWALNSFDFFKEFKKNKYDVVIIHGWQYLNNINALIAAKLFGSKVYLRAESPLSHELLKPCWKKIIKKIILPLTFKLVDKFLYIGEENRNFYKYYGVKDKNLFFAPYSVNNEWFIQYASENIKSKSILRNRYGIKDDETVFIFVGKLSHKKRPMLILQAMNQLKLKNIKLIIVGAGPQENELREYTLNNHLESVIFAGYQPQDTLRNFFLMSDVFILPSGVGETWGLVVNEALNYGLPVILSDLVGSSLDLCKKINGIVVKCDDLLELSEAMSKFIGDYDLIKQMGKESLNIVQNYSPEKTAEGIINALTTPN